MKTRLLRLARLHLGSIAAALLVPALYFIHRQYGSGYADRHPEKWAGDAIAFLQLFTPCAYVIGWGIRLSLVRLGRATRAYTLIASAALGLSAGLLMVAEAHLVGHMPFGPSDIGLPIACLLTFFLPAALFVLIAGPQNAVSTSSAVP